MAKIVEAEQRRMNVKVCMKCNARNNKKAERCRKCGSTQLRPKNKKK
jgi:large subunit ribosomal protein L40e